MTPADRAEYIVACIRKGGAMYPEDAEQFLAEHDAHRHTEVLSSAADWLASVGETNAAYLLRTCDVPSTGQAGKDTREGESTQPADSYQATRGEPVKAAAVDGQLDRTDWVFCSHRVCPNGEYRAKAAERGWHQGPMDAWLCTTHAPGGGK